MQFGWGKPITFRPPSPPPPRRINSCEYQGLRPRYRSVLRFVREREVTNTRRALSLSRYNDSFFCRRISEQGCTRALIPLVSKERNEFPPGRCRRFLVHLWGASNVTRRCARSLSSKYKTTGGHVECSRKSFSLGRALVPTFDLDRIAI